MSKSEEKRLETQGVDPNLVKPGGAVVTWKDRMAAVTAKAANTEASKGGFLSFKGGRISYDDTPIPGDKLNVVVVDFVLENTWFKDDYNPLKSASPVCYALGREESDLKPHAECEDPQNEQCEGCQFNEWGSNRKGGRGKDCKNTRRIAVIPADAVANFLKGDKDAVRKANVVMCKLPVTSIKAFSKYVNQIVRVLESHPFSVLTELSVTPDPVNQFSVNWKVLDQITDSYVLQQLYEKHLSVEKLMFQPYPKMDDEPATQPTGKTKY